MGQKITMARNAKYNRAPQGILYLCATPIGNLGDITLRALECLREADFIAAENIAHSRKLLSHYGIKKPLLSYREANREKMGRLIVERLKQGAKVALISDAGMPAISDPGRYLLPLLLAEKIPFTVLPGASALLTALVASGYPAEKFVFWGFLRRKKGELRKELEVIAKEEKAVVLYEAPHRLITTLAEMAEIIKERPLAVCRELTKKFEEIHRGTARELLALFQERPPRGEITLVISPLKNPEKNLADCRKECAGKLLEALQKGKTPTEAVKAVARELGMKRQEVYEVFKELKENKGA